VEHRRLSQFAAAAGTVLLVATVTLAVVTQQNRLAEQDARFDAIQAEGRELEIRLKSRAQTLSKNVRFMANLPPIQGIIDARREGRPISDQTGDGDEEDGDEEDGDEESVWRERLATIFRGLLIANPDYLAISFSSVADSAQEIVRVERHSVDGSFVRVVPDSRLGEFEKHDNLQTIMDMKPGDVLIVDSASVENEGVTTGVAGYTLLAGTPIYDEESGDVFGLVAIEMNLEQVLAYLLDSTANAASHVYITDGDGIVLMHHSPQRGTQTTLTGRPVATLAPKLDAFFSPTQIADTLTDGESIYAARARLESRRNATTIGLVLTLDE